MAKLTPRQKIKRAKIEASVYKKWIQKALYAGQYQGSKHKQYIALNKEIRRDLRNEIDKQIHGLRTMTVAFHMKRMKTFKQMVKEIGVTAVDVRPLEKHPKILFVDLKSTDKKKLDRFTNQMYRLEG